jgi:hypothetical protein
MDAQTIKIIQRLVLEVAGIGVLVWGLVFIFKGLTGKISFVLKGPGFGVKLANASPGVFLSLLGALMMWFSMKTPAFLKLLIPMPWSNWKTCGNTNISINRLTLYPGDY